MVKKGYDDVGRFMVAVGAVVEDKKSKKILIVKRSKNLEWQAGEWELVYGRMSQFETPEEALKRELKEEVNLKVKIGEIMSVWHIFRGKVKDAENELVGVTYRCQAISSKVKLSAEHSDYQWVSPQQALKMVKVEGISKDIKRLVKNEC